MGLLGFAGQASASSLRPLRGWLHPWPTAGSALGDTSAPATPSSFIAGYGSDTTFPSLNLTTTFVVPKVKCGHKTRELGVGITTLSPGGPQAVLLVTGCQGGTSIYVPVVATSATRKRGRAAHPGDKVVLHEKANSTSEALSFVDKTHPKATTKLTTTGDTSFSPAIADYKNTSNGSGYPIPNFGKITFTNTKLNGQPFGTTPLTRFEMVNSSTVIQIATSPFASNNESFKTTFKHS